MSAQPVPPGPAATVYAPAVADPCPHVAELRPVTPSGAGCQECLDMGDIWVHLRICLTCGHAGCCDSSKNKHATKHHHTTGHPVIMSFEPGESWLWCYADEQFMV